MKANAILLSVQPKYVEKILAGEKKVELRRIRPRLQKGDLVIIYASSPVMAVLGSFMVDHVVTRHPSELWPAVEHFACISRKEFDTYYKGSRLAVAIFFLKAQPVNKPLRLGEIRERWPEFHPPQGYRYLASMDNQVNIFLSTVAE
jgi:predicted transcriptional regulator